MGVQRGAIVEDAFIDLRFECRTSIEPVAGERMAEKREAGSDLMPTASPDQLDFKQVECSGGLAAAARGSASGWPDGWRRSVGERPSAGSRIRGAEKGPAALASGALLAPASDRDPLRASVAAGEVQRPRPLRREARCDQGQVGLAQAGATGDAAAEEFDRIGAPSRQHAAACPAIESLDEAGLRKC